MLNSELKKQVDRLIMQHGVAAVYSIINSVTCERKNTDAYNAKVSEALDNHFHRNTW